MRPLALVALALLPLGCGGEGVNVGAEEPCAIDESLARAQESAGGTALPTCATIGRNQLVNGNMESPALAALGDCPLDFCQIPAVTFSGWRTTSDAQVVEVWSDGYTGVPAPEGDQFVELDADTPDTLYQDLVLTPGELVYWSVLHRGRLADETIEVFLGAPDRPVSQGAFTSSDRDWQQHDGLYRVASDEDVTRFALASRSGTAEGNLVDRAVLAPIERGPK